MDVSRSSENFHPDGIQGYVPSQIPSAGECPAGKFWQGDRELLPWGIACPDTEWACIATSAGITAVRLRGGVIQCLGDFDSKARCYTAGASGRCERATAALFYIL